MSVYIYGLTPTDVLREIPGVDPASISSYSEPVSTSDIEVWLTDGASQLNTLLDRSGITPSAAMDASAHGKVGDAVKAYAVHKCLQIMGITGPVLDAASNRYNAAYASISNRPQTLGAAYSGRVVTAMDTSTTTDRFSFIDSEGSIW